jgi:hypothetical protein
MKGLNCQNCAGKVAIKIRFHGQDLTMHCVRMASNLITAEAERLKAICDLKEVEKLVRKIIGE